jgi:hypothetical protein
MADAGDQNLDADKLLELQRLLAQWNKQRCATMLTGWLAGWLAGWLLLLVCGGRRVEG